MRGWTCYAVAALPHLSLEKRVELIHPLADDPHYAPREWGWLALRPHFIAELEKGISLFTPWTHEGSEFLRRFASEALLPTLASQRPVTDAKIKQPAAAPARQIPVEAHRCALLEAGAKQFRPRIF